ncbi:transcriptional factor Matalpha1 [Trichomonascus vanleenenianus]|uniref:transcriptional factor Matalpha1 n=1 Tax=Trichomonascus vanleenenianus TaxID=2268995 RepID=UPI003ECB8331
MVSFRISALPNGSGTWFTNFIPPVITFHNVTGDVQEPQDALGECVCPIPEPTEELSALLEREKRRTTLRKTGKRRKSESGHQKINGYIAFKLYYGHILPSLHQVQLARVLSKIWANYDNQLVWDYYSEQYMRFERNVSFVKWLLTVPKSSPQSCLMSSSTAALSADYSDQQVEFIPMSDFYLAPRHCDDNIEWFNFLAPNFLGLIPGTAAGPVLDTH